MLTSEISDVYQIEMGVILLFIFVGIPIILFIIAVVKLFLQKPDKSAKLDALTTILGPLYMCLLMWLMTFTEDYPETLYYSNMDEFGTRHTPIASWFTLSVIVFAAIGVASYALLRFRRKPMPPLVTVVAISGVYIGIVVAVFFIIQFGGTITTERMAVLKICYLLMCMYPAVYIMRAIRLIQDLARQKAYEMQGVDVENYPPILRSAARLLKEVRGWWLAPFIAILPLVGVVLAVLLLFGQRPDAFVRAFTETSDWALSQQVSPPSVVYDAHYLCTVALQGDKKLVKPTRQGLRHGEKIVVNRQLCVANAFEEAISDRFPRLHRGIRHVYDTYGYPLSKHITTAKRANVIYIIMKPLEWLFLGYLYCTDVKPENRIAGQYTGNAWQDARKKQR